MVVYVVGPGSTSAKLALARVERGDNPALPSQLRLTLHNTGLIHPASGPGVPDLRELSAELLTAAAEWPDPEVVVAPGDLKAVDDRSADGGAYRMTPELAAGLSGLLAQPHGESDSSVGAALSARTHAIALTGGIARWSSVSTRIESRVSWIAPASILPGELDALAESAGRVLNFDAVQHWPLPVQS